MSTGGLVILGVLVAFCGGVVFLPLFRRQDSRLSKQVAASRRISALNAERDAILNAVRELDFDYQTGKLEETDYRDQRAALMARGVEISRELETVQTAPAPTKPTTVTMHLRGK